MKNNELIEGKTRIAVVKFCNAEGWWSWERCEVPKYKSPGDKCSVYAGIKNGLKYYRTGEVAS